MPFVSGRQDYPYHVILGFEQPTIEFNLAPSFNDLAFSVQQGSFDIATRSELPTTRFNASTIVTASFSNLPIRSFNPEVRIPASSIVTKTEKIKLSSTGTIVRRQKVVDFRP